jgi:hypothetical protein
VVLSSEQLHAETKLGRRDKSRNERVFFIITILFAVVGSCWWLCFIRMRPVFMLETVSENSWLSAPQLA